MSQFISVLGSYFLYNFTFDQSMDEDSMSKSLQQFIADANLDVLGCWKEEIGTNSERKGNFYMPGC